MDAHPRIVDRVEQCAWCQRTLLTGERPERYLTEDDSTVPVCELCTNAADEYGWIKARDGHPIRHEEPPPTRREGRLRRLFARRDSDPLDDDEPYAVAPAYRAPVRRDELDDDLPPARYDDDRRDDGYGRYGDDPGDDTGRGSALAGGDDPLDPFDAPRTAPVEVPRPRAGGPAPEEKLAHAVLLFNESSFPRTMAGIAKALGEPEVSVVAVGDRRSEVVITVAWELTWYQFLVDEEQLRQPVRQLRRGEELSELSAEWREINALARSDGTILLTEPGGATP